MKKNKTFDCVEMKRLGSAKLYEQLKTMDLAEELNYWQQKTRDLHQQQEHVAAEKSQ